jgi:hypothetical protein
MVKGYGNMTNVEKKMNRADLLAYKAYDNKQYCLIPGLQSNILKKNLGVSLNQTTVVNNPRSLSESPEKKANNNLNKSIDNVYQILNHA